jgi:hypothetical protein
VVSVVQSVTAHNSGSAGFVSASFASAPSVGSVVWVFVGSSHFFGVADASSTAVADNQGSSPANTYNRDVISPHPSGRIAACFTAKVNASSGTFTVTYTSANSDDADSITLVEVSSLASSSWIDQFVTNSGSSGFSSGNLPSTTAQADEIEFAYVSLTSTPASIDSFSPAYINLDNSSGSGGGSSAPSNSALWYRILTATTNVGFTGSGTGPTDWVTLAVTAKGAVAGAGAPPPQPAYRRLPMLTR